MGARKNFYFHGKMIKAGWCERTDSGNLAEKENNRTVLPVILLLFFFCPVMCISAFLQKN